MKYFVLVVTYNNGKKGAFPTDSPDLATAMAEFKTAQIKATNVLEDKSYANFPSVISAEIIRILPY